MRARFSMLTLELLTKCLCIYFKRKKAVKKRPFGVIPYILSSFLSSKRSLRGGSGPPLPPLGARRVLSYAPTSERQTCPRTRSAACAALPDSPARFIGRDAAGPWDGVMYIARRHCHAQNHTVVRAQGLVAQVVLAFWFLRSFHMPCLRISPAHALVASAAVPLDLLCPLLPAVSGPFLQCLQSFFLVAVQPFPVCARFLQHLHQMLRHPGGIGLYMGGVSGCQPSADQTFPDALTHHFLKQPTENLAKRRLATA